MGNERETSLPSWRRGFDSPHPLHLIATVSDLIWPVAISLNEVRCSSLRLTRLLLVTLALSAATSAADWLINLLETRHAVPLSADAAAALVIFLFTVSTTNWFAAKACFPFRGTPRWHTSLRRSLGPIVAGGMFVWMSAAEIAYPPCPPNIELRFKV